MCVCVCVCVCVYEKERERKRQTDSETETDSEGNTGRYRETKRDTVRVKGMRKEGERNRDSSDLMYLYFECKHLAVTAMRRIYNSLL